ncbi:signal peptide peptidase SppA [bacterium]|nr:signal peptide peptidase SppA [bacterium]
MSANENQDGGSSLPPQQQFAQGQFQLPPARRRISGLTIFLIILCGFLFMIIIGMGASKTAGLGLGDEFSGKLTEKIVTPSKTESEDKIAMISILDAIDGSGSHVVGKGMVENISKQLRKAAKDDNVKAVLIQMSSPGGGLTASDILRNEVMRVQKAGKKVVVHVGNLAASGGLYIASPSDYIIASPTSLVGSIGVIMTRFQVRELIQKLGIKYDPIKSTDMKDIGSPFRDLSPEERQYFSDMIQTFNDRFISIVAEGRGLEIDAVRKLANGKIYLAGQALEYKLIDEIGYFDQALEKTKELAGVEDPKIIKYANRFDDLGVLSSFLNGRSSVGIADAGSILQSLLESDAPKVMAIWNGRAE